MQRTFERLNPVTETVASRAVAAGSDDVNAVCMALANA
jgi:hypothetical protein